MRHLGKKKKKNIQLGQVTSEKITHFRIHRFMLQKKNIVFYSNEGTIDYNQQCHPLHLGNEQYKQFPQNRKNIKKEKERGKERKRE